MQWKVCSTGCARPRLRAVCAGVSDPRPRCHLAALPPCTVTRCVTAALLRSRGISSMTFRDLSVLVLCTTAQLISCHGSMTAAH